MSLAEHNKGEVIDLSLGRLLDSHIYQGIVGFNWYNPVSGMDIINVKITFSKIMYTQTKPVGMWCRGQGVGTSME